MKGLIIINNICLDISYTRSIVLILSDDDLDLFAKTTAEHLLKLTNDAYMLYDKESMDIIRIHVKELTNVLMDMHLPAIEFEFGNDSRGRCNIKITHIIYKSSSCNPRIVIPFHSWPQCHQFVDKLHEYGFGK